MIQKLLTHPVAAALLRSRPDAGLLALRLMLGVVFVYHGAQKLFGVWDGPGLDGFAGFLGTLGVPFPHLSAILAGSAELFGGLALATGLGLRLLALPLTVTMLVASFTAHTGFDARTGGAEYPLSLAAAVFSLGLIGPGRYSLGALLGLGKASEVEAGARDERLVGAA